jgi:hypothetical protein
MGPVRRFKLEIPNWLDYLSYASLVLDTIDSMREGQTDMFLFEGEPPEPAYYSSEKSRLLATL